MWGTASKEPGRLLVPSAHLSTPYPTTMWGIASKDPKGGLSWCPPIPPPTTPPTMCGTASNESRSLLPWSYQGHINEQLMYRLIYTRNGAELFIGSLGSTCSTNWVHYCQFCWSNSSGDVISGYFCAFMAPRVELIAISDDVIVQKPIYFILFSEKKTQYCDDH